jgi:RNA polymerase sigma-70 factor (ECF subfamily)
VFSIMSPFGGDLDLALAAAREGEERGFAELWHRLQPAVLRYLQAVAGDSAADVADQTWQEAAREIRGFAGDAAAFRVWLFRVARYRALEQARKAGRRTAGRYGVTGRSEAWQSVDDAETTTVSGVCADADGAASGVDPGGDRIGDNGRTGSGARAGAAAGPPATERALRLVARLPREESEAVLLRVVAGLDAAQAAMVLGVRDEAARTAAARGLRKLALIVRDAAKAPADSEDGRRRAWSIE